MYQLPASQIRRKASTSKHQYPAAFSLVCPHCSDLATFTSSHPQVHSMAGTVVTIATCPACSNQVSVVVMSKEKDCVFIFPAPTERQPIGEDVTQIPAVDRAYKSAIQAFNVGLWDACMTSCRKTLEGIVKTQGSSTSRTLFQQLRDFFEEQDLSQPLVHLTDIIREGGNLGAHFDQDKEPDQSVARMMLDLIEYFLEFIYILPNQSQELENRLQNLNKSEESS